MDKSYLIMRDRKHIGSHIEINELYAPVTEQVTHIDCKGAESLLTNQKGLDIWMEQLKAQEYNEDYVIHGSWFTIKDSVASRTIVTRYTRLLKYAGALMEMLPFLNEDQTYCDEVMLQFYWTIETTTYLTGEGMITKNEMIKCNG